MKKYTADEILAMDKKADVAITTMTLAGVGIGFAPVIIDIAAFMAAMGTGVVAIGKCYYQELTKDDAGELIKKFFMAAGTTLAMVSVGQKLVTSVLKSNAVTYVPAMVADAVICGATAFAVGTTSKNYFHRRAEGKKASEKDIKKWMKEGKIEGKKVAKKMANEKKKEIEFDE